MGTIGEEELMKWEKMQGVGSAREEKILVLVRLKPLSEKEIAKNEVSEWECINRTSILFRNRLQERSMFPTAYTFDSVFGGDCSTRLVYEEGAKEIALSVVSGINSSIFAYGQTSSGKTYTMIGITEYTVADIYDYIQRHEERAFVLKFSAMEIYNEAVRDLLSTDNMPLRLLDDPEKGTVVEKLTEETLRDWRHLKELLSLCEAQRQTGETSLNETSSRSHQILRLTIESSAREFLGKDKSTTLAASVNFVDLAGSERASQALSVGQRLKEGCHINRSLLTLGTVIRKLSKGRHGHVNYRDSKLTRILQPCLGGNARTAIICTLSPARSHVEQSRNTLLFASCAKEVSTNAQVNVVMSDKALVKHLQKELANLEIELRTHGSTPTSDYVALLRKKDVQIEKLEKDVKELTKQRDLAQSQIEKLLLMVRNDQDSRQWDEVGYYPKWQEGNSWEDQCSVSKSSGLADQSTIRNNRNSKVPKRQILKNDDNNSLYDEVSSSNISKFLRSVPCQHVEEFPLRSAQDSDDICKEVRCIEMDESSKNKIMKSHIISNGENEGRITLERKIQDLQKTINSLVSPYADGQSVGDMEAYMSSSRSLNLTRSRSCRANLMIGSSSPGFEMEGQSESTPLNSFEKKYPVRPEGLQRKLRSLNFGDNIASLSRYDSQTSVGTAFTEGSRVENKKTSGDEDIPSVGTFVAGLKEMAKLQYETQAFDDQVREMELKAELGTPSEWPLEFERQQRSILELWEICNVSLVHRTYFFLLFKGDPMDSIYMEVEIRRLSFLNETFSKGNPAVEDGRTLTPGSSVKALRRERELLSRLMYKRFSDEERNKIYVKWGISLDSKRRRFQLVHRLWSDANDMNHIKESAAIVAKLVRFLEQGQALKEMFGLSFTPLHMSRRSSSWKHSMASLL